MKLSPDQKLDPREVLRDLEEYRPRRKGWTWRHKLAHQEVGPFVLEDTSEPLARSVPLPSAHSLGGIDPQCDVVVTTEIASGRFEDDLRRMRMAAWHGADHLMVIRTTGQSHIDGLLEGTPEGVGDAREPQEYLTAGSVVQVTIERIGKIVNHCAPDLA